ncbi:MULTISPECIES: phosphate acetyltransferase [Aliarcobacter]|jgi:phosphate acetyltransferase|uniref:Phosphate acetyltransferase n=2 Tax=Aliarcobacter skirrowii TaxID=28200 RepID=A0AAD0WP02_9BACT|nr:phosphate acetyltransferase [Aliarcobacter skirrowii]AXX85422.1 phosphate acetyltransferase [Aliarcobacter skirrowii CCUG 10374]AZL54489.1 phosphate acetyltransferase [Aliarcobacter skirrowii]KAB0621166.1 phosphate acetyltransferase [Aliarcobacter skirrowii CCUG 10374]MDX3958893.1 phosphate acetyltransferase [Aliarcobacter skirrowii]MDX4034757.1 phosphate acetyltransferase [Aliarcobacter skirrowii]
MGLIENIKAKAKQNLRTIVLPESEDERVLKATEQVLKDKTANIILIGNEDTIKADSAKCGANIEGAKIIDPKKFANIDRYINELVELRKSKNLSKEEATNLMLNEPRFFGCMMVRLGDADGLVAGSNSPTADVLKAAIQVIKTAPGINTVSSTFIMETADGKFGDNGLILFADCAVIPDPTSEQLADIASATAATAASVVGLEPRVAMLSFSTKGSAAHPLVDKVTNACDILKQRGVNFEFDGELQADAAIVASVGSKKAPDSKVAGKANILVFPDLQSGNIGYKLVQRFANAEAHGPIIQGLNKPVNDLSRGCSVEDISNLVAITATQIK